MRFQAAFTQILIAGASGTCWERGWRLSGLEEATAGLGQRARVHHPQGSRRGGKSGGHPEAAELPDLMNDWIWVRGRRAVEDNRQVSNVRD